MPSRPYFLREPSVVAPLLLVALIALFAPERWAGSPYWPATFVGWMESLFPPMGAHARKSAFPATTALSMALSFLLLPLHAWYACRELRTPTVKPWYRNLWTLASGWELLGRLASVLVVMALFVFSAFAPVAYDFNLLPYHSSRAVLAAVGWVVAGAAQGWMLAWIACNLIVIARFMRGNRSGPAA